MELEWLCFMCVEIVSHKSSCYDEDDEPQDADAHPSLMTWVDGWRWRGRCFQGALENMDDPIGCKNVGVYDITVIDVSRGGLK